MQNIKWITTVDLTDLCLDDRDPGTWKETRNDILTIVRRELHMHMDGSLETILRAFEKANKSDVCAYWWDKFYDWADLNYVRVLS